jgi:hypothetical protein
MTPLYRLKRKAEYESIPAEAATIEKVIMSYTTMAHAAKQVMIEDHNAKKLLGLS